MLKKQLHVFALLLLLIGQTILGPLTMVSAEGMEQPVSNVADAGDEQAEGATNGDDTTNSDNATGDDDTINSDNTTNGDDITNSDNVTNGDDITNNDNATSGDDTINDTTQDDPENGEVTIEDDEEVDPLNLPDVNLQNDVKMGFESLKVSGSVNGTITDPTVAHTITPKLGDKVEVNYTFTITPSENSGIGSHFKFDLPPALLNFNQGGLDGSFKEPGGEVEFKYVVIGKTVHLELTAGYLDKDLEAFTGTLRFYAEFSADGSGEGLDQKLEIPLAGTGNIDIPFTFVPDNTGKSMYKSGVPLIEGNDRYIKWEVWTNLDGANLQGATLEDTLGGPDHGLELEGNIEVEQYVVGLNGVASTAAKTTTATSFPVKLEDGRYAYKLTYKTKVTRVQKEEQETFTNSATLTNGSKTETVHGDVTHEYGTKLDKEATNQDKYKAKWKIEYNYFGSKMNSQTLTDTITGPHKIKDGTIKVYNVSVDSSGAGTKGAEYTPSQAPAIAADGKSFKVDLPSPNGEAYLIEYETELDSEYVTTGGTVDNTVSYPGVDEVKKGFSYPENIFHKRRGDVDQDKKEITWTITVNAEKAMKDFVIEDDFTSYVEGGTRQKLIGDKTSAFTISNGSIPTVTLKGTDGDAGFKLEFGDIPQGDFTITYKTKYDILPNGTAYSEYKNTAKGSWKGVVDGKDYSITKSADYSPKNDSPTALNGYKDGKFNHVDQVFDWNLAVNINKQDIDGAELVDVIGEGHELIPDSIKVHQLNLGVNDEKGTPGIELETGRTITPDADNKGFKIKFANLSQEQNHQAYIITYQTKDSDIIIGHENGGTYGNTATFKTPNNGEFPLSTTAFVEHANELIGKTYKTSGPDETITWTVDVNKSHSNLGEGIELNDIMSDNQLLLVDTFKIRDIEMDTDGNVSYTNERTITPKTSTNNSFTLELPSLNQKGYQIEYTTFFLGGDKDKFSNKASISFAGATTGTDIDAGVADREFNFNDSSGTITSTRGKLELHKVGLNPITGVSTDLDGVQFELWNKSGSIKLQEATTENGGRLTFDEVRYGKYLLKEVEGTPSGYIPLPVDGLEITMGDQTNFDTNDGNLFVVENIEDITPPANACTEFTLTVKGVDGDARQGIQVKLVNKNTGKTVTAPNKTNEQGQVVIGNNNNLPAGPYEVFEVIGQDEVKLGDIIVNYVDCKGEIAPTPSCTVFTITIEDKDNIARPNVKVTLKHKDDNTAPEIEETTGSNGKFTVPSTTKPGVYKVYEGKQYLGEVTITYKENVVTPCEAVVTQAPTCEKFTLTVRDVDGAPHANFEFEIKDKAGNSIEDNAGNTVFKTDGNGLFTLDKPLPAGEYEVYEKGADKPFAEFASNPDCEASVQPAPNPLTCSVFTITVKDEGGKPRPRVEVNVTVINKDGNSEKITATTNDDGEITIPNTTKPGNYKVFEGELLVGDVDVSYKGDCEADVKVTGAPTCTDFTLTVNNKNGLPREEGVKVTIKDSLDQPVIGPAGPEFTTNADGKIEIGNSLIKAGAYTVYENGGKIGDFTVKDECSATVQPAPTTGGGGGGWNPPAPACKDFTVTAKDQNGNPRANVVLTLKNTAGTVYTLTTNANGEISLPFATTNSGQYTVYEGNIVLGSITVYYSDGDCQAEVTSPIVCTDFTITVKDSEGKVRGNVSVTVKDKDGKVVASGTTNAKGEITVPNTVPSGKYTVYEGDKTLGTVTIDFAKGNCKDEVTSPKACTDFTLTVKDTDGNVRGNMSVTVKDAAGKVVASGTTNAQGEITVPNTVPTGSYTVFEGDTALGTITIDLAAGKCDAVVTIPGEPEEPGEPDGPEEPEEPGTPEQPGEPGTPGEPDNPDDGGVLGGQGGQGGAGGSNGPDSGDVLGGQGNQAGSGTDKPKLPQTGDAYPIGSMLAGFGIILAGFWLLIGRRAKKNAM